MNSRIPQILEPPIIFHAPNNSTSGLQQISMLADNKGLGLQAEVWMTKDGIPVLNFGKTRKAKVSKSTLRIADFYESLGNGLELLILPQAESPIAELVSIAEGYGLASKIWLAHSDVSFLEDCRSKWADISLIHIFSQRKISKNLEAHAGSLSAANIDAISMSKEECSPGRVTMLHRFGLYCFVQEANLMRNCIELFDMGVDAISGKNIDFLLAARNEIHS